MDAYNSIISCGPRLRMALMTDGRLEAVGDRVFPVVSRSNEQLPFIAFARTDTFEDSVKGARGPMAAIYEFQIYSETWEEGLRIADAVADVLDGFRDDAIRACRLMASNEEFFAPAKAYVQSVSFKVKTNN
ncbi:MAG: hypothetical protein NC204_05600 [Candidatus Amulumruptor caecigallinarius]|nr:hypothetical protein [Candidatus Amulumruptor caecigallinarius]